MRLTGENIFGETWSVESSTEVQVKVCCFCKNPVRFVNPATRPVTKIRFRIGTTVMDVDVQKFKEQLYNSEVCPYCGAPIKGKGE